MQLGGVAYLFAREIFRLVHCATLLCTYRPHHLRPALRSLCLCVLCVEGSRASAAAWHRPGGVRGVAFDTEGTEAQRTRRSMGISNGDALSCAAVRDKYINFECTALAWVRSNRQWSVAQPSRGRSTFHHRSYDSASVSRTPTISGPISTRQ